MEVGKRISNDYFNSRNNFGILNYKILKWEFVFGFGFIKTFY